ncbi:MAG: hypothetical protein N3B16_12645, partial [Candidatus Aminicenantes bacterium]|nr:hypothetical protein [Candidatus Aminicenantes bacterium]
IFQRTKEVLTLWRQQKPNGSQVRSFQTELASLAYACFLVGSKPNDELPAPQNLSCQLIMNRSLFMKEWGHYLSWERPPVSLELAQYRIYEISRGERKLIVDLPATQLSYFRRNIDPNKSLVYAVVAIDKQGKESNPAVVKVLVPWLISQIESFFPVFIH